MLYALHPKVTNKLIPVGEFHQLVTRHLKIHLPIKVCKRTAMSTKSGWVYLGGTYYSDKDFAHKSAIEIVFSYHTKDTNVKITNHRWTKMCILFADTILHEIIHMRQYRARAFKAIPGYTSTAEHAKQRVDQEYYGSRDEMGAFSFNIACELYDRFGTDYNAASEYLDTNQYKQHKKSTWFSYMKTFDGNHQQKVIQTMKRKIRRLLPYASTGRPFKTSNWLTY